MDRIAHKIEIPLPPSEVFKEIADPEALAELMPGTQGVKITEAERTRHEKRLEGLEMDLITQQGKPIHARIVEHVPNKSCAFEDDKGTKSRWVCVPLKHGTLLTNEILGNFGPDRAAKIESEAMDRLNDFVERHLPDTKTGKATSTSRQRRRNQP